VCFEEIATIIDYCVKHAMHKPDSWLNEMTDRVFHGSPEMMKVGKGKKYSNCNTKFSGLTTGMLGWAIIFLLSIPH
jgi:hypothetical protein